MFVKDNPRLRGVVFVLHPYQDGETDLTSADHQAAVQNVTSGGSDAISGEATNGPRSVTVGLIRTRRWHLGAGLKWEALHRDKTSVNGGDLDETLYAVDEGTMLDEQGHAIGKALDIDLGTDTRGIAQGLFAALRELDERGADVIFVDGIDDKIDIAAAVMNRLRKAASEIRS